MPKRKAEVAATTSTETVQKKTMKMSHASTPNKQPYSSAQKTAISEFTGVTQADKTTAGKFLKQHNWNVGAAVNAYFNNPNAGAPNPLRSSLSKTFDQYREDPKDAPDEINMEGCSKVLEALGIEIGHPSALVFSEIVQSPSLGMITREGFVDGWTDIGVDTFPKMSNVVSQRTSELAINRDLFKNVYNHAFVLGLQEGKQKSLGTDMAFELWRELFRPPGLEWKTSTTPWLDWWLEFYEEKVKKAVNKDLWKQTLNFAEQTMKDDTLSFWSEESSWPSVIDEFVEWVKSEKRPANGDAMEIS